MPGAPVLVRPPKESVVGAAPFLAFVFGVCLTQQLAALPSPLWLLLLAPPLAGLFCLRANPRRAALWILLALTGVFYASLRAEMRLANESLPDSLLGETLMVEGVIVDIPQTNEVRTRFDFRLQQIITPNEQQVDRLVRLNAYHRDNSTVTLVSPDGRPLDLALREGMRLRLPIRLRQPFSSFNPHGFDYVGYLFSRGIRYTGYWRHTDSPAVLLDAPASIHQSIREDLLAASLKQKPLLAALVLGDRTLLSEDDWRVLRRTGTAHIVSISGAHLGFIFLLIAGIVHLLWRQFKRLTSRLPATHATLFIALPLTAAYALFTGFAIPVQRSFFMIALSAIALLRGSDTARPSILAMIMAAIVLFDPWVVIHAGFWLSFCLTAVIIYITLNNRSRHPIWTRFIFAQFFVSMLAIPLTLWFFNEASLISPIANFILIPAVGFVALPFALIGAMVGVWTPADVVLDTLWQILRGLSDWPHAAWSPARAPVQLFALAVAGAVWLLLPRGVPLRLVGLLPIVALGLWQSPKPAVGDVRLTVLDVGQGNALVLRTASHTFVYDTGRRFGGLIVSGHLRGEGINELDALIISHNDYDHSGGRDRILADYPAGQVIAEDGDIPCRQGHFREVDGVRFDFLHPSIISSRNRNDHSCVLLVRTASGKTLLLTGDISARIERKLIPRLHHIDILLVAHHGSRSSSDLSFLQTLSPDIALISAGPANAYGHPHRQTLRRLEQVGATLYRTDWQGAIVLDIGETVTADHWRERRLRYWHSRSAF